MYTELQNLLDGFLSIGVPGFDCMIMKNGVCVFRHSGGYSDLQAKTPIRGDERYNIYSSSKVITCTAALQLWEQGAFSLDDPLADYLPAFREMTVRCGDTVRKAEHPILIRHLFGMSAGFSYDYNLPALIRAREQSGGKCPTVQTMEMLAQEPLMFEPGERWLYSFSHDVLAALVEKLSGMRFAEYVKKNIFDPLGMDHSTFHVPDEEVDTVSPLYVYDKTSQTVTDLGRTTYSRRSFGSEFESGGAGCVSTVEDYMKFLEALRIGDVILKKQTIDMMTTDHLTPGQRKTFWWGGHSGYGLGVQCPSATGNWVGFGWSGAAGAYPLVDRESGLSFFYARHILNMNNDSINDQIVAQIRKIIAKWREMD